MAMISGLAWPARRTIPVAVPGDPREAGLGEEPGHLGLVHETERVRDHHGPVPRVTGAVGPGAGVGLGARAGEAEPSLVRDELTGHRADVVVHVRHQARRLHPLPGVPRVPALPLAHGRIPGLERDPAARGQVPGQGAQRRADLTVLQEQLEHVPGHDDQAEAGLGGQAGGVGLDPAHPVAAGPGAGHGQHRRRWVRPGHLVPPGRELAGEPPGAAAHVQNPGRRRAGQAEVERRGGVGRIQRVVQGRQPRIGVARTGHGHQTRAIASAVADFRTRQVRVSISLRSAPK